MRHQLNLIPNRYLLKRPQRLLYVSSQLEGFKCKCLKQNHYGPHKSHVLRLPVRGKVALPDICRLGWIAVEVWLNCGWSVVELRLKCGWCGWKQPQLQSGWKILKQARLLFEIFLQHGSNALQTAQLLSNRFDCTYQLCFG